VIATAPEQVTQPPTDQTTT